MKTKHEYLIDLELETSLDYSEQELKKQYRKLSVLYHEDITGDREKHRCIIEAYYALKNKEFFSKPTILNKISVKDLHKDFFSMMDSKSSTIHLKNNDNNVIKVDNKFINVDSSKLSKPKTIRIGSTVYKVGNK